MKKKEIEQNLTGITIDTVIGKLSLIEKDGAVCPIKFGNLPQSVEKKNSDCLTKAQKELAEYFEGKRQKFTFPILMEGTDFQKKVWTQLQQIPYGTTVSYKDIAIAIGNEKSVRAVGMANHKNPLPIVVPCHRVLGADGALTGYAGGLDKKESLLKLEGAL